MSRGTFTSQENKGFLWNLLYRNGTFDKFDGDMVGSVKTMFEATIDQVSKSPSHGRSNITEQNKEVLMQVTAKCKTLADGGRSSMPVTAADAQQIRQQAFDKSLASRQQDFDTSINASKPKAIDFSDKEDQPIGSEMESLIADAIARRKNDLNVVLQKQDTDAGSQWINKDNDGTAPSPEKHIRIGEDMGVLKESSVEEIGAQKRVTFSDNTDEDHETDWLSMLKTKDVTPPAPPTSPETDSSAGLERRLTRLEDKLDEILKLLRR